MKHNSSPAFKGFDKGIRGRHAYVDVGSTGYFKEAYHLTDIFEFIEDSLIGGAIDTFIGRQYKNGFYNAVDNLDGAMQDYLFNMGY